MDSVQYALKPATRIYASTARLNLQHYIWKDQCGYLLHPSILIPNHGRDLKVADVGTGTGIWLLDLARTLPSTAQLDGFDIDIYDCPPKEWLPKNVSMQFLDALGEIPNHLNGIYDIIQLRLFHTVVRDNDPVPLLRNVMKMLKPGGYIQWGEYDMTTPTNIKASPDLSTSALDAIPAFVHGFKKKDTRVGVQHWVPNLPTTFATQGLQNVAASRHATSNPFLPAQLDLFLLTYEELATKMLDTLPGGNGDHLRGLIEKGSEEARKGVAWAMDRVVVVGRKSLEAGEAGREGGETTTPASLVADGNGGEELKTEGKNAMSKS